MSSSSPARIGEARIAALERTRTLVSAVAPSTQMIMRTIEEAFAARTTRVGVENRATRACQVVG